MRFVKYLFLSLVFVYLLLFFTPKRELYYLAEEFLSQEKIFLSHEKTLDKGFQFQIKDANLIYEEISLGVIEDIDLQTFLLYNSLTLKNALFSQSIAKFVPQKISHVKLIYSIVQPLEITIQSSSDLGELNGSYDIKNQVLTLVLQPSKEAKAKYSQILREFKNIKGVYHYEKPIKFY